MPNCKNKIKKKQIVWVPYTTDDDEFCTISPGGAMAPSLTDYLLFEDTSNGGQKFCGTVQQLSNIIQGEGGNGNDTFTFGDTSNNLQNKFLTSGENGVSSNLSAPLTLYDGHIEILSISSDGLDEWTLDIVLDAFDGGAGTYSGGTLLGSVIKPAGQTDVIIDTSALSFDFLQGQRVGTYARKAPGQSGAAKPLVRLYLRYD